MMMSDDDALLSALWGWKLCFNRRSLTFIKMEFLFCRCREKAKNCWKKQLGKKSSRPLNCGSSCLWRSPSASEDFDQECRRTQQSDSEWMESTELLFLLFTLIIVNSSILVRSLLCFKKFVLVFKLFSFFIVMIIMEKNKMKLDLVKMKKK